MTTRFTKEQIQQARQADLFAYLQANEPGVLKKDGRNYRHREHDSLVYVTAKNFWYWNSRGKSITALDYLMEIRGFGFAEAVFRLIGDAPARASPQAAYSQNDSKPKQQRPAKLYMEAQGYALDISDERMHHEIYLSDARKVAPEKQKTVIRHPIKKAER